MSSFHVLVTFALFLFFIIASHSLFSLSHRNLNLSSAHVAPSSPSPSPSPLCSSCSPLPRSSDAPHLNPPFPTPSAPRAVTALGCASRDGHGLRMSDVSSGCTGIAAQDGGGAILKKFMSVLDKYLLGELLPPLFYGAAAFTLLGVSIGNMQALIAGYSERQCQFPSLWASLRGAGPEVMTLVEKLGMSVEHILLFGKIISLRLPSYVGLALPMASLLASMLAYGRLGADSELIALQAGGITTWRMLWPSFLIFMAVTALHLLLAEGITPLANRSAKEAARTAVASVSMIQASGRPTLHGTSLAAFNQPLIYPEYRKGGLAHMLYAHGFDGKSLLTVTFLEMQAALSQPTTSPIITDSRTKASAVKRLVIADKATWDATHKTWVFSNGCEYYLGDAQVVTSHCKSNRRGQSWSGQGRRAMDVLPISLQAVRHFRTQYVSGLTRAPLDLAELGVNNSFDDMTLLEASRLQCLMEASRNVKESRKFQVKIQQRISLPFASLIFGLVGSLLSLRLLREQKRVGMALTFAIVFVYYSASVFGSLVGQLGYVSPIVGAWLPNLLGTMVASALLSTSA